MAAELVKFNRSAKPTLGVEWELGLVDAATHDLTNRANEVFAELESSHSGCKGKRVHRELLQNTVELVTGICQGVPDAVEDLSQSLSAVKTITDGLGIDLYGAGLHPWARWEDQNVTPSAHYEEIIDRTQIWGREMIIWGVHIHVGISHEEKVMPIINGLLSYYPHLLALSASSPFWRGVDTGYASMRTLLYQQLPTAGLPWQFCTWSEWESYVIDQLRSGVVSRAEDLHLDIRPSPKLGTIEVRISDSASNLSELSALAALTHSLIVDLDRRIDAGEDIPTLQPWHVRENKWRAARYGLEAEIIVDRQTKELPVTQSLDSVLNHLEPVARDLQCDNALALIPGIVDRGASYQRQRSLLNANRGSFSNVIGQVCSEL